MSNGLVREFRKEGGFKELIEGSIDKKWPVFIIDDILSSGESINKTLELLLEEGYNPTGGMVVFKYDKDLFRQRIVIPITHLYLIK